MATLQALEADVAALAEVENDGAGPETAIVQFAEALNAAGPARDWRAVEVSEGPGSDVIRVGVLYRTGRVTPVGAPVFPTDPIFSWGSRPPLGQAFARVDGEGEPWLVVSNHLKSKGGCPDPDHPRALPGDRDLGDGQACWNAHRVQAATALADWIDGDPAGIGVDNVLIVGDLNSYGREDPIRLLEGRGWVDAFAEVGHILPYSYVFQGEAGRLDHVLIRNSRVSRLRGAAIWITQWMARAGIPILRVALGIIFIWFGALKLVPGLSPAEELVLATVPFIPGRAFMILLALWEIAIGLGFLTGRALRLTILLLFLQIPGTLSPILLLPEVVFTVFPYGLTLEGQYIVKNLVLVSAALVIGATVRGGRLVEDP